MEELDLRDFFKFLKKKFLIVFIIFIMFFIGAFVYCKVNREILYETKSTLIILSNTYSKETKINNITIGESLNKTLFEIIKSKKVFNKVIDELKLDMNYNELSNIVSITLLDRTGYIEVVVKDKNNKNIVNIANKIVEVFNEEINNIIENNNIIVNVVDEAIDYKSFSNISSKKIVVTSSFVGIFVGFVIVYILYYFNDNKKINKR